MFRCEQSRGKRLIAPLTAGQITAAAAVGSTEQGISFDSPSLPESSIDRTNVPITGSVKLSFQGDNFASFSTSARVSLLCLCLTAQHSVSGSRQKYVESERTVAVDEQRHRQAALGHRAASIRRLDGRQERWVGLPRIPSMSSDLSAGQVKSSSPQMPRLSPASRTRQARSFPRSLSLPLRFSSTPSSFTPTQAGPVANLSWQWAQVWALWILPLSSVWPLLSAHPPSGARQAPSAARWQLDRRSGPTPWSLSHCK